MIEIQGQILISHFTNDNRYPDPKAYSAELRRVTIHRGTPEELEMLRRHFDELYALTVKQIQRTISEHQKP